MMSSFGDKALPVALLMSVMQGADPRDPRTLALRDVDPMPTLRRGVKGLRLAPHRCCRADWRRCRDAAAYDRSVERLASHGCRHRRLPCLAASATMAARRAHHGRRGLCATQPIVDNNDLPIDEAVRPRVRGGAAISSREYLEVLAEREQLKLEFAAATADVDALLAPVTMTPAIPLARSTRTHAGVLHALGQLPRSVRVAVPNGFTPSGLPLSLQIVCPGGRRGHGPAHRLGLAERNRLARACPTNGGVSRRLPPMSEIIRSSPDCCSGGRSAYQETLPSICLKIAGPKVLAAGTAGCPGSPLVDRVA